MNKIIMHNCTYINTEKETFINRLRIMKSIDRHELEDAGIIGRSDIDQWGFFQRDPFHWLMRADDEKAEKLWELIEKRAKKWLPT